MSSRAVNRLSVSFSDFDNGITPVEPGVQLTFPSMQAGSSFRVPQGTTQQRWQFADALSLVRGTAPVEVRRPAAAGRTRSSTSACSATAASSWSRTFPAFDRNGDGRVNDDDLLFAVTLRSGKPDQDLVIPDADNVHLAGYVQDDWRVHPQSDVEPRGPLRDRHRREQHQPRRRAQSDRGALRDAAARSATPTTGGRGSASTGRRRDARTSIRGGYGIYYDRVTLQIQSLERGLDGRALPIEVRAGNLLFMDPATGRVPPFAPTVSNPFTGFILPGAGASGINIIDSKLQNPKVQQVVDRRRAAARDRARWCGWTWCTTTAAISSSGERSAPSSIRWSAVPIAWSISSRARRPTTTRCWWRSSGGSRAGSGSAAAYTLSKAQQLRQRRSDPVRERSDRPGRSAPRVRPGGERPAASSRRSRAPSISAAGSSCPDCGPWPPACRWTS